MEITTAGSILLVGVGGQGTLLASKILTTGLMSAGYDVKMNEIHGMSQRGGSVSSHVRYGSRVFSPVIDKGAADILVAFEEMEALRWLEYMKPDGKVIINRYRKEPLPVLAGEKEYPRNIPELISDQAETVVIDAAQKAVSLGNVRVMNSVLIGSLVQILGLGSFNWDGVISDLVKPEFTGINLEAFRAGREMIRL